MNGSLLALLSSFVDHLFFFFILRWLILVPPFTISGIGGKMETYFPKLKRILSFWGQIPNSFFLDEITGFYAIYAEKVEN